MTRAAAGDRAARHELFVRFRDDAYRVAFRITGRDADAMDVVQDAFIKAFDSLGGLEGGAVFRGWLLRIVSNRGLDILRKRKVRMAVSLDGAADGTLEVSARQVAQRDETPVGEELENRELAARVQDAIEQLPAPQKAVMALYAAGEMTYGQIAEALGIPIGTVMSRLYHARRRLKELLPDLAEAQSAEETES